MRRAVLIVVVLAVVAGAGFGLLAVNRGPQWTTSSPEALAELDMALEARMKLYVPDAAAHARRALELDPDFVAAKLQVWDLRHYAGDVDTDAIWNDLETVDVSRLTPRERLLVLRARAMKKEQDDEAGRLVEEYLEAHPDDPFVLDIKARMAWTAGEMELAEQVCKHLVDVSPNWVYGYNLLGYVTMSQSRFAEAEEYFTSYRFIAPDQANPHDSLGELYIVLGRYDDAVASLEEAIRIKPDFLNSYGHLALVHLIRGDFDAARDAAVRLAKVSPESAQMITTLDCVIKYLELEREHRWKAINDLDGSDCCQWPDVDGNVMRITHRAAVASGHVDRALAIEDLLRTLIDEKTAEAGAKIDKSADAFARALLEHMAGVRLALGGKLDQAVASLEQADDRLNYISADQAFFKLWNRLVLVEVLRGLGHEVDAHQLLDKVRVVNPALVQGFEDTDMKVLGIR